MKKLLSPKTLRALCASLGTLLCVAGLCPILAGCQRAPSDPPLETEINGGETATDTTATQPSDGKTHEPKEPVYLDPADSTIPCIFIDTEDGKTITSTSRYIPATLTVMGGEYAHYNVTAATEIRGRGHSSFERNAPLTDYASKNSYRLKLRDKINLLGVSETADRDWVLISGKYDVTGLRNYLIWNLADRLGTIPYVPSCTWVNLYLNGEFRGMYTLTEPIDISSDRVHIDDSASVDPDTVGYLVEYDLRGAYAAGARQGLTYFYLPGMDTTFAWTVKSTVHNTQVTSAIREHLIQCNTAILSGDRERMEEYVDLDSFVDMFILQELSKNPDAGCSSFYMQRDASGKLHLTAPWDFDFAMGSYSVSVSTAGLVADGEGVQSHPWFEFLVTQPWFMKLVLERMEEIKPLLEQTLKEVEEDLLPYLKDAADANHERWNLYGQKFSIYPANQVSIHRKSYRDHVHFLVSWVEERWGKLHNEVKALT